MSEFTLCCFTVNATSGAAQGRTQGGGLGLNPPLSLMFYKKLYYLRKGN